jgi:AcrR family transcriptional regulator
MNQLSRRERNRLERQNRILDAAIKVFAEAGFPGASMEEIARQAGLSKPTLYQYFTSKEALFEAMMAAPREGMMLAFDDAANPDMVAQLLRFAWSYAETVMRPEFLSLARLIIGEAQRFPDVGRDYQASGPDQVLQGLIAFMEAQRNAGRLVFDDAELAAEDFWGLILSAPRNRALHIPDTDVSRASLARYIHNGLRVFLRAYSAQPDQDLARLDRAIVAETAQN